MIQASSAAHAKAYFADALSRADYYIDGQELNGRLQGRLAERLGIEGPATKQAFYALCENRHPATDQPLTPRTKQERRVGYDINFHCPKSVSILQALAGDDHLQKAFEASVRETMQSIEADVMTRVRKGGAFENRSAGELVWADFTHLTARPVEGHAPDPHLHAHCFVFNATWDAVEGKVKAGEFGEIKRDMPYYQAVFHKRLSDKIIDLGYQIRRTEKSFEVEGVPSRVIDLFSKRTDEIGRVAQEQGITDAKERSELGARTRSRKEKGMTMTELKSDWRRQITELGDGDRSEAEAPVRYAPDRKLLRIDPEQCVDHALSAGFERASVLGERKLLAEAIRHGIGSKDTSVERVLESFQDDQRIIRVREKGRSVCTTQAVLAEEKRMVDLARKGQGRLLPLYRQMPEILDQRLNQQQRDALQHVLTSPHRVSLVRGAAGAGKTTLLKELAHQIREAGHETHLVAPTTDAARTVLREEGFAEAETVAKLLSDRGLQEKLRDQVLVVDEAGLLGTRQMTELLDLCTRQDARLVLVGDTRQHSAVERGDALRILNTVAGIPVAEVSKIQRQQHAHYRQAVQELAEGDVRTAFERLDGLDFIREIDPLNPSEKLAEDYLHILQEGKSALVISPTHAQGDAVTAEIRERLRKAGRIGKRELAATRLTNCNLTEAEKADWRSFERGCQVQFNQNLPGIRRGSVWTVVAAEADGIRIADIEGRTRSLPLASAHSFDVYDKGILSLSKGDKVRITRNGFDADGARLNNGQQLEVVKAQQSGALHLRNAQSGKTYRLDRDFGHLAHAYCTTSHASQGKTVDVVLIAQPAATFPATDAKQFYVSVSRGREECRIYTDDKAQLLEHAAELGDRQSALELVAKSDMTKVATDRIRAEFQREPDKEPQAPDPTPTKDYDYGHPRV